MEAEKRREDRKTGREEDRKRERQEEGRQEERKSGRDGSETYRDKERVRERTGRNRVG